MQHVAAVGVAATIPTQLQAAVASSAKLAGAASSDASIVAFYLDQLCLMPGDAGDGYRPPTGLQSAQSLAALNDEELAHYVYRI